MSLFERTDRTGTEGSAVYPPPVDLGETGEVTAVYRPAMRQPELVNGRGAAAHYLATGASTRGQFGLYRWDLSARPSGPGPHFHRTLSESFFVLLGTVQLYNGEGWIAATAGDFLYIPEGGLHGFRNESGAPASMLILFTPGAPREPYFETLAEVALSGRTLTDEEWTEFYLRHDNHWVE